jgi:DNA-binding SARP family transcriptional activator/tetratricopeptide (TPR) repeat protein
MGAALASGESVLPRSRKTRAVLAVLASVAPRPVLRTRLITLLWGRREREQAQGSLRQSVHELRLALGPRTGSLLKADRNHLALLDDRLWVDVHVLAAATVSRPGGLELFQRTLLEDLVGIDPAFDRWLQDERERLTRHARSLAERVLAEQYQTEATIVAADRLLFIDPLHEAAWQALIRSHLDQGDRAAARHASARCTTALANAGLTPSTATAELVGCISPVSLRPARNMRDRDATEELRLAVLPPRTLEDARSDALSLGLAEEITAALSRFRWITCVDGTLSVRGGGLAKFAGQELQRLDLDYLLDSTLQRSGNLIRIIVRLLDVRAGGKVAWVRRFDRELDDVLTLQGEIASETAAQIDPTLLLCEGQRLAASGMREPKAYNLIMRAIPAMYRLEPSGFHAAGESLAAAVATDPNNAAAHAWWAYWHVLLVGQGWASDPPASVQRAGGLAERAVTLDPSDARALALVGHVRGFLDKLPEKARDLHERAISLNPNLPLAWCFSGGDNSYLGRHEEAIEQITEAQRLSPHDPHAFFFDSVLMIPHLLRGDFETVATLGQRAIELNPRFSGTYKGYLSTLGHLGRDDEAARVLARLLALEPGFSVRNAMERSPLTRREDLALYAEGLRRGGLREG